jgi:hypothetical protein
MDEFSKKEKKKEPKNLKFGNVFFFFIFFFEKPFNEQTRMKKKKFLILFLFYFFCFFDTECNQNMLLFPIVSQQLTSGCWCLWIGNEPYIQCTMDVLCPLQRLSSMKEK